jgi:hypothetical protein
MVWLSDKHRLVVQTMAGFAKEYHTLENQQALKIGIQIRLGDASFASQHAPVSNFQMLVWEKFSTCAEQIQLLRSVPGQDVVWYIISDSLQVRRYASSVHGDKILAPISTINHVSANQTLDHSVKSLETVVAEHWLFGMTDYQIITTRSGLGRSAALRTMKSGTIYSLEPHILDGNKTQCGEQDFRSVYLVSQDYSMA